jgi:hypothetical protein
VFHARQHQTELVPFSSTVIMQLDVQTHSFKALLSCHVSLLKKAAYASPSNNQFNMRVWRFRTTADTLHAVQVGVTGKRLIGFYIT